MRDYGKLGYSNMSYDYSFRKNFCVQGQNGNQCYSTFDKMENEHFALFYTINGDLLFNFYNTDKLFLGSFIGFGLGGQLIVFEGGVDAFYMQSKINQYYIDTKIGFRIGYHNHGMELSAIIPFIGTQKYYDNDIKQGIGDIMEREKFSYTRTKFKQNFIIYMGYSYTF